MGIKDIDPRFLAAFSGEPPTGGPRIFTGTIWDFDQAEGRLGPQLEMHVRNPNGNIERIWYGVVTDRKTGQAVLNKDGEYVRVGSRNQWTAQQKVWRNTGLPAANGGQTHVPGRFTPYDVIGLVGRFEVTHHPTEDEQTAAAKAGRNAREWEEKVMVEWSHYDNERRQEYGLAPRYETAEEVALEAASVPTQTTTTDGQPTEAIALEAIVGKEFVAYLAIMAQAERSRPDARPFMNLEAANTWIAQGILVKEGKVYQKGRMYDDYMAQVQAEAEG